MQGALFSIVTVCRNDRDGLARTHRSLAAQGRLDVEWLVQDGASEDGTVELAQGLADPAAALESAPDAGLYDAMNRAMARATGHYVLFLNAGDVLADGDVLARLAAAIGAARPAPDFVYGDAWESSAAGWRVKRARSHRLAWTGMFTHHQAMLCRRAAVAGLAYPQHYAVGADYAFTLAALARATSVLRVDFPLCRFASGGLSQRRTALGRAEQVAIRRAAGVNPLANHAVAAAQSVALAVKRRLPGLYGRLRYRAARN